MADKEKNSAIQGAEDTQNQGGQDTKEKEPAKEMVNMTKEEYEKALLAEADKRVDSALKTREKEWERQYREKLEKEKKEAERLARLSAEEREKELLSKKDEELTVKERELKKRELKLTAIDILSEEKLPVSFADQLLGDDADETHDRIKKFKKAWHEAIDEEVNKRLKGVVPREGASKKEDKADMNQIIRRMAGR